MQTYRCRVVNDPDFWIDLEYGEGTLMAHCEVGCRLTPSIYKRMMCSWCDVEDALLEQGCDKIYSIPYKPVLQEKMGWVRVNEIEVDGEVYGVYLWELGS